MNAWSLDPKPNVFTFMAGILEIFGCFSGKLQNSGKTVLWQKFSQFCKFMAVFRLSWKIRTD